MKAIILAAGKGTRLGEYTRDLPKGMLQFMGKSLVERQVETYRRCGVSRIIVVGGYRADRLDLPGTIPYVNEDYEITNMVESLMCARGELEGDVLVSYGDVLFEDRVLRQIMSAAVEIGVTVDKAWRPYWEFRYGDPSRDTESLGLGPDGRIVDIGRPDPPIEQIDGRYVGLLKFAARGVSTLKEVYDSARAAHWGRPWRSSRSFQTGYMTDLLQEIIDRGHRVDPLLIEGGWLEFDTTEDYEKTCRAAKTGELGQFFRLMDLPPGGQGG
ncbi:MAG: phosphocholine cytidylyltransferase family protein [Candidatus Tectomicrobia bacterium]|uniref:Phosphocholine cytidylyltransferase family protein n=1 Tax=Tectimicrobiota bacterium TaxID=2528274 RepID=A0A932HYF3_UNCTE|nr:phosphocholine cytidylyltransferase family protein [Candidatus Tectomicrobia bacterium]